MDRRRPGPGLRRRRHRHRAGDRDRQKRFADRRRRGRCDYLHDQRHQPLQSSGGERDGRRRHGHPSRGYDLRRGVPGDGDLRHGALDPQRRCGADADGNLGIVPAGRVLSDHLPGDGRSDGRSRRGHSQHGNRHLDLPAGRHRPEVDPQFRLHRARRFGRDQRLRRFRSGRRDDRSRRSDQDDRRDVGGVDDGRRRRRRGDRPVPTGRRIAGEHLPQPPAPGSPARRAALPRRRDRDPGPGLQPGADRLVFPCRRHSGSRTGERALRNGALDQRQRSHRRHADVSPSRRQHRVEQLPDRRSRRLRVRCRSLLQARRPGQSGQRCRRRIPRRRVQRPGDEYRRRFQRTESLQSVPGVDRRRPVGPVPRRRCCGRRAGGHRLLEDRQSDLRGCRRRRHLHDRLVQLGHVDRFRYAADRCHLRRPDAQCRQCDDHAGRRRRGRRRRHRGEHRFDLGRDHSPRRNGNGDLHRDDRDDRHAGPGPVEHGRPGLHLAARFERNDGESDGVRHARRRRFCNRRTRRFGNGGERLQCLRYRRRDDRIAATLQDRRRNLGDLDGHRRAHCRSRGPDHRRDGDLRDHDDPAGGNDSPGHPDRQSAGQFDRRDGVRVRHGRRRRRQPRPGDSQPRPDRQRSQPRRRDQRYRLP